MEWVQLSTHVSTRTTDKLFGKSEENTMAHKMELRSHTAISMGLIWKMLPAKL
jgi:hypothetical protein